MERDSTSNCYQIIRRWHGRGGGGGDETLCHNIPNLSQMLHYASSTILNFVIFRSFFTNCATFIISDSNFSLQVNISNTWTLPQPGFNVFYRHFRDKISWFEADAVCQFHHANLVTGNFADKLFMAFPDRRGRCAIRAPRKL